MKSDSLVRVSKLRRAFRQIRSAKRPAGIAIALAVASGCSSGNDELGSEGAATGGYPGFGGFAATGGFATNGGGGTSTGGFTSGNGGIPTTGGFANGGGFGNPGGIGNGGAPIGGVTGAGGVIPGGGNGGMAGNAGATAAGGAFSNGGSAGAAGSASGGFIGAGGATGGTPGAGGAVSSGGTAGTGGAAATGGAASSGGATGTGGAVAAGGTTGTGGAVATGGATGTGGVVATGGVSGTGGGGSTGPEPTKLPTATGTCPSMSNLNGGVVKFAGQDVTVWSGNPSNGPGPLLIYWYATGSSANEPTLTIGQTQIQRITSLGGVVAAQNKTTAQGSTTGNNVWYTGDAAIADEIVACSIKNQGIDPRRIHSAGYSAGALQTVYMWYARSGYIASVLSYSGGVDFINQPGFQDSTNVPAAIAAHGASGQDTFGGFDFYTASHNWETAARNANGFIIDCDDGGTHTAITTRDKIAPQAVQFFLDHPFKVSPEPYTSLPSGWPSYCTIVP